MVLGSVIDDPVVLDLRSMRPLLNKACSWRGPSRTPGPRAIGLE